MNASISSAPNSGKLVQPDSFLTLHYRLAGPDGRAWVNTFGASPATLSLGQGELSPALEAYLIGLAEGQQSRFDLAPGVAFGAHNPELMQRVSLSLLRQHGDPDERYQVGDVVRFPAPQDQDTSFAGVLCELGPAAEDWAVFDFNHPLAGQPVTFEVHIIGVL